MASGRTVQRGADVFASLIRFAGLAVVGVLVLYILLTLFEANPANGWVVVIRQLAELLNLGLGNLFVPEDPKAAVTLNYGVAALIWWLITAVGYRLVRRIG